VRLPLNALCLARNVDSTRELVGCVDCRVVTFPNIFDPLHLHLEVVLSRVGIDSSTLAMPLLLVVGFVLGQVYQVDALGVEPRLRDLDKGRVSVLVVAWGWGGEALGTSDESPQFVPRRDVTKQMTVLLAGAKTPSLDASIGMLRILVPLVRKGSASHSSIIARTRGRGRGRDGGERDASQGENSLHEGQGDGNTSLVRTYSEGVLRSADHHVWGGGGGGGGSGLRDTRVREIKTPGSWSIYLQGCPLGR
jgi:hypothetical protein